MDSGEIRNLSSAFIHSLASSRDAIGHKWYHEISLTNSLISDRTTAIRHFLGLADRIIDFLTTSTQSEQEAREIGHDLAELRCTQPEVIDVTWKLWTQQLTAIANPTDLEVLYPRMVTLISSLTSGYLSKVREIILAEQEQIRLALVFNVEKTTQQLREYQLHLEDKLVERTQELRVREEQYRLITETSLLGIFQVTWSGFFVFVNEAFCNMVGYTREELIGRSFQDLIFPDDLPEMLAKKPILEADGTITEERVWKHKNGHSIDSMTRATRLRVGDTYLITAFVEDVSDQKQVEAALRQSEARYRTLVEASRDMITLVNRRGEIEYANISAAQQVGMSQGDLIGKKVGDIFPPQTANRYLTSIMKTFESGQTIHIESPSEYAGNILWFSTWLLPIKYKSDEADSILIVSRDLSERKQIEENLRNNASTFRALIDNTADTIWSIDTQYRLTSANASFHERNKTITAQQVRNGDYVFSGVSQALVDEWKPLFARALTGEAFTYIGAYHARRDGNLHHETSFNPIRDLDGVVLGVACFSRDITDRKRAEDALRISEERYRTLAESAKDLILTVNGEYLITYANSFAGDFLGVKPEEIVGKPSSWFFRGSSGKPVMGAIDSVFHAGTDLTIDEQLESQSSSVWYSFSLVPFKDTAGRVVSVFILAKDISDLKKSEHALLKAKSELEERVRERTATLVSSQMRARELARQVITAQEEERRRMARELHDQSGQALISIKISVRGI